MSTAPTLTPNVRIQSPKARKIIGDTLGWIGVAVVATTIVDGSIAEIDLTWLTVPASQITLGLLGLYQTLITSPNVGTEPLAD